MKVFFVVYKDAEGTPKASEVSLNECLIIETQKNLILEALQKGAPDAVYQAKKSRVWVVDAEGKVLVDTYRETREI